MDTDNLVSTFLNPIFVRTVELLFTKVKKTLHSYFGRPELYKVLGVLSDDEVNQLGKPQPISYAQ